MKKRIIAAMTALVMVVTMIPGTAFAASETNSEVATRLIKELVEGGDKAGDSVTVHYTNADLKALNDATLAYENLGDVEKIEFNDGGWDEKLTVATAVFKLYLDKAKAYKDAAANIKENTLDSQNLPAATEPYNGLDLSKTTPINGQAVVVDNIKDKTAVDMNLVTAGTLKSELVNATTEKTYVTADVEVSKETNDLVKALYQVNPSTKVADAFDGNLKTALQVVEGINGKEYNSTNKSALNDMFDAVNASMKIADYGKCVSYIYLSKDYNDYYRVYMEKEALLDADIEMNAATEALTDKYDGAESPAAVNTPAVINVDTYESAKADKVVAEAVAKKYEDTKYDGEAKTGLATEIGNVTTGIEQYEAKVKIKNEIEALAEKTMNMETYYAYTRLKAVHNGEMDTIDNYFTSKTVAKRPIQAAYNKLGEAATAFETTISKADLANYFGQSVKNKIKKLPSINKVKISDYEAIKTIVNELNDYIDLRIKLTDLKDNEKFAINSKVLKFNSGEINFTDTSIFDLSIVDSFIAKSPLTGEDIEYLAAAVKGYYNIFDSNEYNGAVNALKVFATTDITNGTLLGKIIGESNDFELSAEFTKEDRDSVAELIEAYEKATAKLTTEEVNKIETDNLAEATAYKSAKEAVRLYDKAQTTAIKNDVIKINTLVTNDDKSGYGIILENEKPSSSTLDIYANNKSIFDKIDAMYAADKDLEYLFNYIHVTNSSLNPVGEFSVAATKLANARAEYEAHYADTTVPEITQSAKTVVKMINELPEIDGETSYADVKAAADAYLAADKAYKELSGMDQFYVSNNYKLEAYKATVKTQLVRTIDAEINANLEYIVSGKLSAEQVTATKEIRATLDQYATILTGSYDGEVNIMTGNASGMFPNDFTNGAEFFAAYKIICTEAYAPLVVEIKAADKAIDAAVALTTGEAKADNATESKTILLGVELYNALSKEAKELLVDATTLDALEANLSQTEENIADLLADVDGARAFLLEYAVIDDIEDQKLVDGIARPEVVVKDLDGNTLVKGVDYDVRYVGNNKVNDKASVIIFALGNKYAGELEVNFKIVADKPVAPTGLKVVDSDQGVLKIVADTVKDAQYKFYVKKVGETKWTASKLKNTPEVTFYGLDKNAKYQVKAVVFLNDEHSDATIMDGVYWTNRVGTKAAAMYKPSIKSVTIKNRVAKITVNKVDYNKVKYALGFKKGNAKNFKWFEPNAKTVKTLKNLKKGVKYTFAIKYQYTSEVSGTIIKSNGASKTVTKVAK